MRLDPARIPREQAALEYGYSLRICILDLIQKMIETSYKLFGKRCQRRYEKAAYSVF